MAFNIIHGDITQVNTESIVLPANPQLFEGPGSSRAIFEAAGRRELTEACAEIGYCPLGSAVITPGFNLKAKNIIHAVCPRYIDGTHKEAELLYSAYIESLKLASATGLKSIAFPLLSAGNYHFPKGEAQDIACKAIRDYLDDLEDELDVELVIYDRKDVTVDRGIQKLFEREHRYSEFRMSRSYRNIDSYPTVGSAPFVSELENEVCKESVLQPQNIDDILKEKQQSFRELLMEYIIRSELKNSQVYHRALITKQVFSNAISGNGTPKKNTILALALALELNLEDTEKLLMKAGYAFSDASQFDLAIQYFIENKRYNVIEVNINLDALGLPIL